jgi:hypothetical protein
MQALFGANLRSIYLLTASTFWLMGTLFELCPHDSRIESVTFLGPMSLHSEGASPPQSLNAIIESAIVHLHSLKIVEIRPSALHDRICGHDRSQKVALRSQTDDLRLDVVVKEYIPIFKRRWKKNDQDCDCVPRWQPIPEINTRDCPN